MNIYCKKSSNKRYYYHVTESLDYPKINLKPRKSGTYRSLDEWDFPKRICVSPTVWQCLIAIPYEAPCYLTVYRTLRKVIAYKPNREEILDAIPDIGNIDEHWLIKPTCFTKIGVITIKPDFPFPSSPCNDFGYLSPYNINEFKKLVKNSLTSSSPLV